MGQLARFPNDLQGAGGRRGRGVAAATCLRPATSCPLLPTVDNTLCKPDLLPR